MYLDTGDEGCYPCAKGYYKDNSAHDDAMFDACKLCPENFTTQSIGSESVDDCRIGNIAIDGPTMHI